MMTTTEIFFLTLMGIMWYLGYLAGYGNTRRK